MIRWWMPLTFGVLLVSSALATLITVTLRVKPGAVEAHPYRAESGEDTRGSERQRFETLGWRLGSTMDGNGTTLSLSAAKPPQRARISLYRPDDPAADALIAWNDPVQPLHVALPRPGVWKIRLLAEAADGQAVRHEISVIRQ